MSKIIKKFKTLKTIKTSLKIGRPRKTSAYVDKIIKRVSEGDPRKSSRQINQEISESYGIGVSSRTIRRRLTDCGLFGRVAVKKTIALKEEQEGQNTICSKSSVMVTRKMEYGTLE